MNTNFSLPRSRSVLALLVGTGALLLPLAQAKAQRAYSMAPPVSNYSTASGTNTVYNWADVPQNQIVPIDRAVFDQGGYQLYDQAGETIVVPFQNNLYAMKFAVSQSGGMYFVNDAGQSPILYVPRGGYLDNATVPGARWYPFNRRFAPSSPVYLGIAPSYSEYQSMGWYPNEVCRGGYYGNESFANGGYFGPTLGLTFIFGGQPYYGWNGYRQYADNYPAPYHTGWYHREDYQFAGRPDLGRRDGFIGSSGQGFHPQQNGFGGSGRLPGGAGFNGAGRPGFGGTASRPGFQGTTNRPGFGGVTARPGFGGTASRPGFSGTTTRPGFGGTVSRPSFGGTVNQPGFRGTASRPNFGGTTSRPSFGGTALPRRTFGSPASRPSFGGTTSRPAFGGSATPRPSFGRTTSRPSFGKTSARPSFGGATTYPSGGRAGAPRPSFGGQSPRGNASHTHSSDGHDRP